MSNATQRLTERITDYLALGGLFNPEMMDHDKVRDLLIDCRVTLQTPTPSRDEDFPLDGDADDEPDFSTATPDDAEPGEPGWEA